MPANRELSLAIPASLVSDISHLREKTLKIGIIGRTAAIFGIDQIIIFPDMPQQKQYREINLIATVLSYMETPQYLRRRLFKIQPELKYAGVLPPLRTPHHPLASRAKDLVDGEYREGATMSYTQHGTLIDVGVETPALLCRKKLPRNTRVTVKIRKTTPLQVELAECSEVNQYWGYRVTPSKLTLGKFLEKNAFELTVATSKYGKRFTQISEELKDRWRTATKILLAFGAPTQGLYEIMKHEELNLDAAVDFVVNTIPNQQVETVRTEEALLATLGILNLIATKG